MSGKYGDLFLDIGTADQVDLSSGNDDNVRRLFGGSVLAIFSSGARESCLLAC